MPPSFRPRWLGYPLGSSSPRLGLRPAGIRDTRGAGRRGPRAAGRARHHETCGLAGKPARLERRRSGDARRATGTRWPAARGMVAFKHPVQLHEALAFTRSLIGPSPTASPWWPTGQQARCGCSRPRAANGASQSHAGLPRRPGPTGYAVGLDVPMSVLTLSTIALTPAMRWWSAPDVASLLDALALGDRATLALEAYERLLAELPGGGRRIRTAWGDPSGDPARIWRVSFRARASATCSLRSRPIAAGPRNGEPTTMTRRCRRAMPCSPLGSGSSTTCALRTRSYGCPWHLGMAARQSRARSRRAAFPKSHRALPVDLSVPGQQSRRSRTGQTPHRRRDHWASPAAACGQRIVA